MLVTKSQVEAWDTTHLDDAADHWNKVARVVDHVFNEVHDGAKAPMGTDFNGQFAGAVQAKARSNMLTAEEISNHLRYAANAAQFGKPEIEAAKTQATEALTNADDAGFNVDESMETVTPKEPSSDPVELDYQMHQAAQHLGAIQSAVTRLNAADVETTQGIMRAANGIHGVDFKMGGGPGSQDCNDARQRRQDKMEDDAMWAAIGAVLGGIVSRGNPLGIIAGGAIAGGVPLLREALDPAPIPECEVPKQ